MQDMNDTCEEITHNEMIEVSLSCIQWNPIMFARTHARAHTHTQKRVSIHSFPTCAKFDWHLTFRNLTTA